MLTSKGEVPVDLGTLMGSGNVDNVKRTRDRVSVEMGYGGAAAAYALAVHEHPSSHSPRSWSGGVVFSKGGPKYLERPALAAARGMAGRLARKLRGKLGR